MSLGATHEQNREDRDLFVKINFENIRDGAMANFDRKTTKFNARGTPYDYESVMHYKVKSSSTSYHTDFPLVQAFDFSKNNKSTITPLRRNITLR